MQGKTGCKFAIPYDRTSVGLGEEFGLNKGPLHIGPLQAVQLMNKELDQRLEERNSRGFKASGSVCDLLSRPQRTQLMETVSSLFHGKLHILVNNAGVAILEGATEYTEEDLSTIMGVLALPTLSVYAESKGAMNQVMTKFGIRVGKGRHSG
ncbi:hypothetical protein VitviT2T_012314 [Vitis vinifera]|uniref:Uncharacterized protein n=1 Tax=Vitis vinifera TaxID=29760 RepID=A0ABY9CFR2_VITVI|nr:hypothetical protein VitviT2T_012314 [Vitis vinifera]